jgi:HD-like signal output (HDOD) protein/CheY-like chemotaxis protein
MAEKRILVADADPKACEAFRLALGQPWVVVGAATGPAAMDETLKGAFDVIVANFDLADPNGAELLNRIRQTHPKTLRFIAADEARKDKVMCHLVGGHQFLAVPFNGDMIKGYIERSLVADYGMNNSMRELVGRIRTFPTIPSLYVEVVNALRHPNATTEDIGLIIGKEMAMTNKLVQVLNSSYFGLPRTITDPTEAVGILGFETVKSLIMTVKLLSQYDKVKPVYFSIDNIWRHSTNVARTARVMALLETSNNECSGHAYTAGLMHDLGKVILAANFDEQYHGAHALARKQQMPLWEVEKDIFGATHGEIGAYLLGLWGLSAEVVKVAALHHHPLRAGDQAFTPLTAVHVANALEYEGDPNDGLSVPVLDTAYLRQLGLEGRVQLWRDARREPDAALLNTRSLRQNELKTVKKPALAAAAPELEVNKFSPAGPPPPPSVLRGLWRWLGLGLGVSFAVLALARLEFMRLKKMSEKEEVQVVMPTPPPTVKHEVAKATPPVKVIEAIKPPPSQPTNMALVLAIHPAAPSAPAPTPAVAPAPAKTGFDRLKLEAIFFSSQHPSALINGQLAVVNQQVADCRVLDIGPNSVTLEYQHQRKTLTIR